MNDGTAIVVISPSDVMNNPAFQQNNDYLPFVTVSAGNTTFPFAANPSYSNTAFNTQANNTSTFALDSLSIDYINT